MQSPLVEPTGNRLVATYRRLPASTTPIVLIVLVVLAGNAFFVLGLTNGNPIAWTTQIAHSLCHLTCDRSSVDPNVGALTQSLGYRAAVDLLHGHLPWWNYFEGIGTPLAGEMQSAALFPFTWLLAFSSGLLWMHILLEVIAGVSTYFLCRRLSVPVVFATMGAMLFALNGTFALLGNAVVNPLPFLPMLLLGIEIILDRAKSDVRRGWYIAAIAVALSLYSGFPEGAYFDALFCVLWAAVRLFSISKELRARALRRLGLAGGVGVVLALPILVPFDDFLKVAFVGSHTSALDASSHLSTIVLPMFFNPYIYGTIFDNAKAFPAWDVIGGYFTASVTILALVGLFGRRLRSVRLMLLAWIVVALGGSFNLLGSRVLWNVFPLVSSSSLGRYMISSCDMAIILLAVLGIADIAESKRARQYFLGATGLMVLLLLWGYDKARPYNANVPHMPHVRIFLVALTLIPFIAVATLLVLGTLTKFKVTTLLVAILVVGESLVLFMVPTVEAPKSITIDYAPISYLLAHQGEDRFLDLGVLLPNWGSEFGLNELSAIDLPFPTAFRTLIQRDLFPGLKPTNEFLNKGGVPYSPLQEAQLAAHFRSYENASLKYLLAPLGMVLSPALATLGVKEVWSDAKTAIYELPDPRPFFSAPSSCSVTSTTESTATVNCASGGATLLRTELSMKGWTATVNGKPVTITTVDGVYQKIDLPAGTSTVHYKFVPPHVDIAIVLGVLAGLLLVGSFINEVRPFIPRRRKNRVPLVDDHASAAPLEA